MRNFALVILITVLSIQCTSLKKYYFQKQSKGNPIIYKFENENNKQDVIYWKIKFQNDIIVTETINSNFEIENIFREQINSEGSVLLEYTNYYPNSIYPVKSRIIENQVFQFISKEPYSYSVNLDVFPDQVSIKKTRSYVSNEKIQFNDKSHNCLVLKDVYNAKVNGKEINSYNITYYANGVGVVKFSMNSDEGSQSMILSELLTIEQFNNLKANYIDNK